MNKIAIIIIFLLLIIIILLTLKLIKTKSTKNKLLKKLAEKESELIYFTNYLYKIKHGENYINLNYKQKNDNKNNVE
jgi:hypothetical protein